MHVYYQGGTSMGYTEKSTRYELRQTQPIITLLLREGNHAEGKQAVASGKMIPSTKTTVWTVAIPTHPNLIVWCVGSFRWQGRDTCTSLCATQRLCFPWHSPTISDPSWRQTWSGRSTRRTQCRCHTLTRAWPTCRKRPTATLTPTARATFINVSWSPNPNCTPITIITRMEKNSSIPFFPFDVQVLLQDGECTLWTGTDNVWTCVGLCGLVIFCLVMFLFQVRFFPEHATLLWDRTQRAMVMYEHGHVWTWSMKGASFSDPLNASNNFFQPYFFYVVLC